MSTPYQTPESPLTAEGMIACKGCTKEVHSTAAMCPHCGFSLRAGRYKSKTIAALFAFFLGGFGAHRFYLGQWWGVFYLLFFWTWIPGIISFIEFIVFLASNQGKWDQKFNEGKPRAAGEGGGGAAIAILIVLGGFMFVAVLGILAAVAIPAYQDYTVRAHVYEAITEVSPVKSKVEDYYAKNLVLPRSNDDLGLEDPYYTSKGHRLEVSKYGIEVILGASTASVEDETIMYTALEAGDVVEWQCTGGSLANKYRPVVCRE